MRSTRVLSSFTAALVAVLFVGAAQASGLVGKPAPAFTAGDSNARSISLADYKGKFVVLEWTNSGCPFVQHYYRQGNMQALQKEYTSRGVIWLSIISSAPGKQGYVTGPEANDLSSARDAHPSAVLLDPSGKLGRLYDARTTPDMVVIDPAGTVVYSGAIDSTPSTDPADIAHATPYVKLALDESMAGKTVSTATTTSYGCSIKY